MFIALGIIALALMVFGYFQSKSKSLRQMINPETSGSYDEVGDPLPIYKCWGFIFGCIILVAMGFFYLAENAS